MDDHAFPGHFQLEVLALHHLGQAFVERHFEERVLERIPDDHVEQTHPIPGTTHDHRELVLVIVAVGQIVDHVEVPPGDIVPAAHEIAKGRKRSQHTEAGRMGRRDRLGVLFAACDANQTGMRTRCKRIVDRVPDDCRIGHRQRIGRNRHRIGRADEVPVLRRQQGRRLGPVEIRRHYRWPCAPVVGADIEVVVIASLGLVTQRVHVFGATAQPKGRGRIHHRSVAHDDVRAATCAAHRGFGPGIPDAVTQVDIHVLEVLRAAPVDRDEVGHHPAMGVLGDVAMGQPAPDCTIGHMHAVLADIHPVLDAEAEGQPVISGHVDRVDILGEIPRIECRVPGPGVQIHPHGLEREPVHVPGVVRALRGRLDGPLHHVAQADIAGVVGRRLERTRRHPVDAFAIETGATRAGQLRRIIGGEIRRRCRHRHTIGAELRPGAWRASDRRDCIVRQVLECKRGLAHGQ